MPTYMGTTTCDSTFITHFFRPNIDARRKMTYTVLYK